MSLRNWRNKQQFLPGYLGIFFNPFFIARRALFLNIKSISPLFSGNLLDVGCGSKPYKSLFSVDLYLGMDIENPGHDHQNEDIDVFYDGNTFPFPDNHFQSIISNQVLEHVFNPDQFLNEIYRCLKPGGYLLLSLPFAWDEHEQPFDYARYSSFGLKSLLEKNGFKVYKQIKSGNALETIVQLFIVALYKAFGLKNKWAIQFFTLVISAPLSLLAIAFSPLFTKNKDLYLDNIVVCTK